MKPIKVMCAAAMIASVISVPAYAQMAKGDAMSSGHMMKMSASQKRMMAKCTKMSHDKMMKNKSCMTMMKMHPDMMKGG